MTNTTLDEHQARVERAEETLRDDLRQLARRGRRIQRSLGTGKMLALCGGAAVLGVLAVRATFQRRQRLVVQTRPEAPSLIGTAIRMALLEVARVAATRLVHRFSGAFEPQRKPELLGPPLAQPGAMRRGHE
ncbi:MAG TPA: hypothetical protein VI197_15215 [Polyangiaceae bacterium]